jgi:hypothetical protein
MTEVSKYDELRQKTERQLHQLIDHELDLGIREAEQALGFDSWAFAEAHYVKGYRAHTRASRLMRLVDQALYAERYGWEAKLQQLHRMLDEVTVLAPAPKRDVACIAHC